MDVYMVKVFGAGLGTCVESWVEQKSRPNSQHKSQVFFVEINQDLTLMDVNLILTVSSCSQVETLPSCWDLELGTHVNRPLHNNTCVA